MRPVSSFLHDIQSIQILHLIQDKMDKIEQFLKKIGRKYNDSLIVYYHLIHDEQQLLLIENQIHNGFIF